MKNKKVLIGLSGGVDSAVAALLLKQQGYEVVGAFMKNFSDTKNKLTGECSYLDDKKDAQKIATIIQIPLIMIDSEKEYKKSVINPMYESYKKSFTPNPDSLCNKIIKFPILWKHAKKIGADYIATGHYAKIKKINSSHFLQIPKDTSKDQTYFLYSLNSQDLSHTIFPLANLTKKEVREIARKNNFPNSGKKGTRGICFVGKVDMKKFLQKKIKPKEGKVLDLNGNVVGKHDGISFYTIGERVGERIGIEILSSYANKTKSKLYISDKSKLKNTITIAPENHPSLKRSSFYLVKTNFPAKQKFPLKNIKVRIRHLGKLIPCTLSLHNKKYLCMLSRPQSAIAEGQNAVFYSRNTLIGGGEIRYA